MRKPIIVINGAGGVGKDTLVGFAGEVYRIWNCSTIEPIKDAARLLGWEVSMKDDKSRKFLSDLKMLSTDYNELPLRYVMEKVERFLNCREHGDILFVHIREPHEIKKFVDAVKEKYGRKPITLLVRRNAVMHQYGNVADDGVEGYEYDYYFDNNVPLEEARTAFLRFLKEMA